jgi:hypothetical protein|tara:strand:- start:13 stop:210 length:198 start_codon:yes stop_codon:yes gene_type:complete
MNFIKLIDLEEEGEAEVLVSIIEEAIERHCSEEQEASIVDYVERRIELESLQFGDEYLLKISELG